MKILIVDDDPVIVTALKARLEKEGYTTRATTDAQASIEYLEEESFDLIISDIVMPYVTGIEILSELQKSKKKTPVILISALDQRELILTAFEMGVKDFITKPINLDELMIRIKRCLA